MAEFRGVERLAVLVQSKPPRCDGKALSDHPDASVRAFAVETVKEIEIFHSSEESYGYVFYVLQRA